MEPRRVLPTFAKVLIFLVLIGVCAIGLPLSATLVEAIPGSDENWIIVVYFVLAAAAGAIVGLAVPGASAARARPTAALRWAAAGVLAAAIAYLGWVLIFGG